MIVLTLLEPLLSFYNGDRVQAKVYASPHGVARLSARSAFATVLISQEVMISQREITRLHCPVPAHKMNGEDVYGPRRREQWT